MSSGVCWTESKTLAAAMSRLIAMFQGIIPGNDVGNYHPEQHYMRGSGPKSRSMDSNKFSPGHWRLPDSDPTSWGVRMRAPHVVRKRSAFSGGRSRVGERTISPSGAGAKMQFRHAEGQIEPDRSRHRYRLQRDRVIGTARRGQRRPSLGRLRRNTWDCAR